MKLLISALLTNDPLVDGIYQPLPLESTADAVPFIHSPVLGLDLRLQTPNQAEMALLPLPKELRFYDPQTELKLLSREEVEQAREQAEQERDLAQQERDSAQQERNSAQQRAEQLAAKLRELGIDPEQI